MARTFYVDSRTGSDSNSGTSATSAFSSLAKVNSLGLQPGDSVLFARGATFNGGVDVHASGTSGSPITFGAYGSGVDPIFANGQNGFSGNGNSFIVVQNIDIKNMNGAAIINFGGQGWTIDGVDVDGAGKGWVAGNNDFSAFQFRGFSNLTIQNSSYKNITGDGVFLWDVNGVKILNNVFRTPQGDTADNIHTYRISNYEIRGNLLDFSGPTNSGKGNMVVQESSNGVIANNTFLMNSAHYGIGGTIQNGVIENNQFIGRKNGEWSTGLNITETLGSPSTVTNMTIRNNFFDGSGMGIYTWDGNGSGTAYRNGFNITGNIFKDLRDPAIVSEWPVQLNGSYANNTLINTTDPNWGGTTGSWSMTNNIHTSTMPAWTGGAGSYVPVPDVPIIKGTAGDDKLVGTDGPDIIWGDPLQDGPTGGNDIIRGGKGDDYLSGGAGNDIFVGERGGGMDTIRWFEAGKDKIDVSLFGWKSFAEMQAAGTTMTSSLDSNSTPLLSLNFGGGDGFKAYGVSTLSAADFVFATSSGGGGTTPPPPTTPPVLDWSKPTLVGTAGDDKLVGTDGADVIWGDPQIDGPAGGNDIIRGGKGDDFLSGGAGNDIFVGERGGGMDTIRWFEAGKDKIDVSLFGWKSFAEMQAAGSTIGSSLDSNSIPTVTVNFGSGDGFKVVGVGALSATDFLFATSSGGGTTPTPTNTITGTTGNDKLVGKENVNNVIDAKEGHDTLIGMSGDDTLIGGGGNDLLYGGAGNDTLLGGPGDDQLFGEAGNDRLDGGAGNDVLTGGAGNDVFVFSKGGGKDLITDFTAGQDKIDLSAFGLGNMTKLAAAANIVSSGTNTMYIDFGGGDRLTIYGVSKLTADHVIL